MGLRLDQAPDVFGYACPWCPVVVIDAGLQTSPVTVFETHIDGHLQAGHQLPGRDERHANVTHLPVARC